VDRESGLSAEERQDLDRGEHGAARNQLRRCIVTREERSPSDLIRFVADPAGAIVPDLARKLPGRGVWVTADAATVAAAAKKDAFAKSLKRQVTVAPDLPQAVETLCLKRALEALSLANKAGLVSTGFEKVEALVQGCRAAALLHGSDAAPGGRRKLDGKFAAIQRDRGKAAVIVDWLTIEQMGLAIGRSNVVHAGLKQGGATKRFLSEAERLQRYRSGLAAS
jgi:uncharacterized protein